MSKEDKIENFINEVNEHIPDDELNICLWEWAERDFQASLLDFLADKYRITRKNIKNHLIQEQ